MNFLSSLFGSVAKATAGFFIALGLMHGAITTSTASSSSVAANLPAIVQVQAQTNPAPSSEENQNVTASSNSTSNGKTTESVNDTSKTNTQISVPANTQTAPSLPTVNPNAALDIPQAAAAPTPTAPTNSTLCNGTTYSLTCPTGLHFFCPTNGQAGMCIAADAQYCNGTAWTACPAGESFSCSSTGGVCSPPPTTYIAPQSSVYTPTPAPVNPLLPQYESNFENDISELGVNGCGLGAKLVICENYASDLVIQAQGEVAAGIPYSESYSQYTEVSASLQGFQAMQTGLLTMGGGPIGEGQAASFDPIVNYLKQVESILVSN